MSAQLSTLQDVQGQLLTGFNKMEERVNALENPSEDEAGTGSRAKKMAAGSRGGASEHPSVKVIQYIIPPMKLQLDSPFHQPLVHTLFYEMCGVDMSGDKAKHTERLCAMMPLEGDLAFEHVETVEGKETMTWHPCWKDNINHKVNVQFIKAVINCTVQNEEVSLVSLNDGVPVLTLLFGAAI
jgi:hypothetical protein